MAQPNTVQNPQSEKKPFTDKMVWEIIVDGYPLFFQDEEPVFNNGCLTLTNSCQCTSRTLINKDTVQCRTRIVPKILIGNKPFKCSHIRNDNQMNWIRRSLDDVEAMNSALQLNEQAHLRAPETAVVAS